MIWGVVKNALVEALGWVAGFVLPVIGFVALVKFRRSKGKA